MTLLEFSDFEVAFLLGVFTGTWICAGVALMFYTAREIGAKK